MFFLQLQQDLAAPSLNLQQLLPALSLCMLLAGGLGILARRAINPLIVLLPLGINQLLHQANRNNLLGQSAIPPATYLRTLDLALCMAVLAYVVGQYRLLALRGTVLPADRRRGAASPRPEYLVTAEELFALLVQLPLWTLVAQGIWYLLPQHSRLEGLAPSWLQFLILVWVVAIGLLVTSHVFRYWRWRQMNATTARVLLQDVLWKETRGEQRRINRWLAWRRINVNEASDQQ
jgi:hypothetical protein